jgi:hypothetical protein
MNSRRRMPNMGASFQRLSKKGRQSPWVSLNCSEFELEGQYRLAPTPLPGCGQCSIFNTIVHLEPSVWEIIDGYGSLLAAREPRPSDGRNT